jgi:hypothetical protein
VAQIHEQVNIILESSVDVQARHIRNYTYPHNYIPTGALFSIVAQIRDKDNIILDSPVDVETRLFTVGSNIRMPLYSACGPPTMQPGLCQDTPQVKPYVSVVNSTISVPLQGSYYVVLVSPIWGVTIRTPNFEVIRQNPNSYAKIVVLQQPPDTLPAGVCLCMSFSC